MFFRSMHWIDALIVLVPFAFVMWLAFRSRRYARGVVDYLAAGRVAGGAGVRGGRGL